MQSALAEAYSAEQQYRLRAAEKRHIREIQILRFKKGNYVADMAQKESENACYKMLFISVAVKDKISYPGNDKSAHNQPRVA
jgi:hypothetical protein